MQTGPKGLGRDDLPKASHPRHFRGFDNEVRVDSEESNQKHSDEADNQAKQQGGANDGGPLALQNNFWWRSIIHVKIILAPRTVGKAPSLLPAR